MLITFFLSLTLVMKGYCLFHLPSTQVRASNDSPRICPPFFANRYDKIICTFFPTPPFPLFFHTFCFFFSFFPPRDQHFLSLTQHRAVLFVCSTISFFFTFPVVGTLLFSDTFTSWNSFFGFPTLGITSPPFCFFFESLDVPLG